MFYSFKKKILFISNLTILLSFFLLTNVVAQSGLNFQGVARNASGIILASQNISLRFSVLNKTASGNAEYIETRTVTTNAQGIFSIVIGDGGVGVSIGLGSFTSIDWKSMPKFLKVELDPNAGNNFFIMGVTQLQSVPYSNYSNYSASVDAENILGIVPVNKGGTGVSDLTTLKSNIGLANVNNTTDLNKPISIATQSAINFKLNIADSVTKYVTPSQLLSNLIDTNIIINKLNVKENLSNKSIDTLLGGLNPSDIFYPTQKAVKSFITSNINAGGVVDGGISTIKLANASVTDEKINFNTPELGTPSLLIGTNITGTASNLNIGGNASTATYAITSGTASNVTTNANLTGVVTSIGNNTSIANGAITNAMLNGSIASSKLVGTDIISLGTVTSGIWSATTIDVSHGGTGVTSISDLKSQLSINSVNNTSDIEKPISNVTQLALDNKVPINRSISINGVSNDLSNDRSWSIPTISSLNGLNDNIQSFSFGSDGISPNIKSESSIHKINLPFASTPLVTAGLITKSDFDQFYNKSDFSGNYNDLSNKPKIPDAQLQSNWNQSDDSKIDFIKNKPSLSNIATSGNYDDLINKPNLSSFNGVDASRILTINGVGYDLTKDRTWSIDLGTSGIDFSKNIISGVLPISNGGTGSRIQNFVDLTNNQTIVGNKQFTSNILVGNGTQEASAIVDINSNSKGFLPPRLTTLQRDAIVNPAIGLTIFNTDTNCLEWWIGTIWYNACGNASVSTTSNGTANITILDCSSGAANGVNGGSFDIGADINPNYSWQIIRLKVNSIGTYTFSTAVNGISYSKSDQFFESDRLASISGYKDIYVPATGAAINAGTYTFKLATNPSCSFTVNVNTTSSNGSSIISSWNTNSSSFGTLMNDKTIIANEVGQNLNAAITTPGSYKIIAMNNGVTFTGSGTFSNTGNNDIQLIASGTPINAGTYTFTTNTTPSKTFTRTFLSSTTNGTAVVSNFSIGSSTGNLYINNIINNTTQTIVANVIATGTYSYTASINGVVFSASGTFNSLGSQNIILQATGIPTIEGYNSFSLNSSISFSFIRQILSSPSSNGSSVVSNWTVGNDTTGNLYLGNTASYVSQTIIANVSQIGTYYISTSINGITFSASGVFNDIGLQNVVLKAIGTPQVYGINNFTINTSNACTFTRFVKNNISSNGSAVITNYTTGSSIGTLIVNSTPSGVIQYITANVSSIGTYSISTTMNGVTFSASGTLSNTGLQQIALIASGMPNNISNNSFILNTIPNSSFNFVTNAHPSSNGSAIINSWNIGSATGDIFYSNYLNNVTQEIIADVNSIGSYSISAIKNGITYFSSGNFNNIGPNQIIILKATGISNKIGSIDFNLNTIPTATFSIISKSTTSNGTAVVSNWSNGVSNGTMYKDVSVNNITNTLIANVNSIGSYNVTASSNNVNFSAIGTFTNTGLNTITLTASGAPWNVGEQQFTTNTVPPVNFSNTVYSLSTNGTAAVAYYNIGTSVGTFKYNTPVSNVSQEIFAMVTSIGTYSFSFSANGITYSGNGSFTSTGLKSVTLTATGTPTKMGISTFISNTNPSFTFSINVPILPVGSSFQGGILAYYFTPTDPGYISGEYHGLIFSNTDLTASTWYSNIYNPRYDYYLFTLAEIGKGSYNTNLIITALGHDLNGFAAGVAKLYNGGAYNDWFLPSKNEFFKAVSSYKPSNMFGVYWTSTDFGAGSDAVVYSLGSSVYSETSSWKSEIQKVRAMRYF